MIINGIGASDGYGLAKAFIIKPFEVDITSDKVVSVQEELSKFREAQEACIEALEKIKDRTLDKLGQEHADIFEAHIQILKDPEFIKDIISNIEVDHFNAGYAVERVAQKFINIFESMDNDYMKERAADIKDISRRLLSYLFDCPEYDLSEIQSPVILVAEDISPSQTAQLNKEFVKGFVTQIGGRTSHSVIMARSLEIPCLVGVKGLLDQVHQNDDLILDGFTGQLFLNPTEEVITMYDQKHKAYLEEKRGLTKYLNRKSTTSDGRVLELASNIGSPEDLEVVINNGAEGIGLFRTEFLYMNAKDFPREEEQYQAYKKVLETMAGKPVVIRTLDIGGDKSLAYMDMPKELNPFLGHRAIRLCLKEKDLFVTQLRALLRASIHGNLKIMFPMIATIEEFVEAKGILLETKGALQEENIQVSDTIEVGMMVEIPSSALLADQFAKYVDFFSIGTNDLIQYTFAADRMNESVSYLYQPYHPSLLRLIKMVIDAAHKHGKWVGMCGEMAGDGTAIPLLVGLGLDEFSMSATGILKSRALIETLDYKALQGLADKALGKGTSEDVVALVKEYLEEIR